MQICRSSSYVKYVSSCSPATSLCPNPDSLEMRLNSISDRPSSTAARRRVTYLSSCVFMTLSLTQEAKPENLLQPPQSWLYRCPHPSHRQSASEPFRRHLSAASRAAAP